MTAPLVSVLLPVRDAEGTLAEALDSLRAQTFADRTEVIAVDDGSTDGTADILRDAASAWPALRVIRTEPRGIVPALRAALEAATGALVARLDADDRSPPHRLERQVALLDAEPEVGVVGSLVRIFPEESRREGLTVYEKWINSLVTPEEIARDLFVECPLAHPSMMMRREELVTLGGYEDRHGFPEDYDLLLRYAAAGWRLAKVPEVLLEWREGPGRAFRTDPRYDKESFRRCKAHHLARGPLAGGRPVWMWGAGIGGKKLARALEGEGVSIRAFVDVDPRKIGRERRGRPIVAPEALKPEAGEIIIAAVAARGAREEVRERLRSLGFVEGPDFVCAA